MAAQGGSPEELQLAVLGTFSANTAQLGPPLPSEEPQDTAVREGMERVERLRHGGIDKERWMSVWLYSEATSASQLSMTIMKDAGTQMTLDPDKGDIAFTNKVATHRFHLTASKGDPKSACSDYTVQIIGASASHVLVQHTCNAFEYRPNKFKSSVDYFLYDLETASMRSIWANSSTGKGSPLPSADPEPKLKVVARGFEFDWQPRQENRGGQSQHERHMSFQRKLIGGKKELVCYDRTFPKSEAEGNGSCQAQQLNRVEP